MISRILLRIRAGLDFDMVVNQRQLAQQGLGDLAVGRNDDFAGLFVDDVKRDLFTQKNVGKLLGQLVNKLFLLLLVLVVDLLELLLLLRAVHHEVAAVMAGTRGRNAYVHHDAGAAGGNAKGSILHFRSLFTEDGAQQAFFPEPVPFQTWE